MIIYIVGVGRSGTSLLHSILGTHSEILSVPETQIFRNIISKKLSSKINSNNYKEIANSLFQNSNIARLRISEKKVESIVKNSKNYLNLYMGLLHEYNMPNKSFICEKDPRSIDLINEITSLGESTKIIHIFRDPRSVVSSRLKVKWTRNKFSFFHSIVYNTQLSYFLENKNKLNNIYEVCYEKLVSNHEEEVSNICKFLNICYESQMLEFSETSKSLVTNEELDWKSETFKPIKNYSNKWKRELTIWQLFVIESLTPIAFYHYKYPRYINNFIVRIINFIVHSLRHVISYLYFRFIK